VFVALALEERFASFKSVPHVPEANLLTGNEQLARLRLAYRVVPNLLLLAEGGVRGNETRQTQFDFLEYSASVGLSALYPAPIAIEASSRWNLRASVGHYWRQYGGPDPVIDPGRTRSENEWRFGITNEIPVYRSWSFIQQLEYWRNNANIRNYDRDNLIASADLSYRF